MWPRMPEGQELGRQACHHPHPPSATDRNKTMKPGSIIRIKVNDLDPIKYVLTLAVNLKEDNNRMTKCVLSFLRLCAANVHIVLMKVLN